MTLSPRWYLTAVAIFRNEATYLEEWLAFCLSEGVEHILLYDNESTDNSLEILQPWIAAGFVEVLPWPIHWEAGAQAEAYRDAVRRLRYRTRWAAFIDIDEYLFSPTGQTLPQILAHFEGFAGVVVNWQCYGTSGRKSRPQGLAIENFTRRAKTAWARNRRVKTIVDPLLASEPQGGHLFTVRPGHSLVTERFQPIRIVRAKNGRRRLRHLAAWLPYLPFDPYSVMRPSPEQISTELLRINHYVTRSAEEVAFKFKNRDRMLDWDRRSHFRYHDRNEVEDAILASKAAEIREIIASLRATGRIERPSSDGP